MNFYYVYVIQNVDNHDEFYVGFTTNLKQRIDDHNNGTTYSTRARTWRIVYCEAYINEQVARNRERTIKNNGRMRTFLMNRVKSQFDNQND